jgi:hypothetical protein
MKGKTGYNLAIATPTYENLQEIAKRESTTIAELLRKAIKWLMFLQTIKSDPNARLLIEQDGEMREIIVELVV